MRRTVTYTLLLTSIFGIAFLSCKKKEYTPLYYGYDYFPNTVGHYIIYDCDSIVRTAGFGVVTYKFQIKEVIQSIFTNNQGQPTQRIVRYKRDISDTAILWSNITVPEKVWTGNLLSNMAVRQEDNFKYAKLVFPASAGETWNGNVLNSLPAYNYQYTVFNSPYTVINSTGSIRFDSTITVLELKDSSFVTYGYWFEQYAAGVGMIHRIINIDSSSVITPGYSSPDTSLSTTWGVWYSETCLTSGYQ